MIDKDLIKRKNDKISRLDNILANLKLFRDINEVYQNTSGKPISLIIDLTSNANSTSIDLLVDYTNPPQKTLVTAYPNKKFIINSNRNVLGDFITCIIMPNEYYKLSSSDNTINVSRWYEKEVF